jgi:hypothetical protein
MIMYNEDGTMVVWVGRDGMILWNELWEKEYFKDFLLATLNPTQKLLTYNTSPWYTRFVHVLRQKLEHEQV